MRIQEKKDALRPFYSLTGIYDITDIKRVHRGHWFDEGAMRFFKSRILSEVYPSKNAVFFVSSEDNGQDGRKYTTRKLELSTGNIETVGEFYQLTRVRAITNAINEAYKLIQEN